MGSLLIGSDAVKYFFDKVKSIGLDVGWGLPIKEKYILLKLKKKHTLIFPSMKDF